MDSMIQIQITNNSISVDFVLIYLHDTNPFLFPMSKIVGHSGFLSLIGQLA